MANKRITDYTELLPNDSIPTGVGFLASNKSTPEERFIKASTVIDWYLARQAGTSSEQAAITGSGQLAFDDFTAPPELTLGQSMQFEIIVAGQFANQLIAKRIYGTAQRNTFGLTISQQEVQDFSQGQAAKLYSSVEVVPSGGDTIALNVVGPPLTGVTWQAELRTKVIPARPANPFTSDHLLIDAQVIAGLANNDDIPDFTSHNTGGASIQSVGTTKPKYRNNLYSNRPVIEFNGSNRLRTADATLAARWNGATSMLVQAVVDLENTTGFPALFEQKYADNTATLISPEFSGVDRRFQLKFRQTAAGTLFNFVNSQSWLLQAFPAAGSLAMFTWLVDFAPTRFMNSKRKTGNGRFNYKLWYNDYLVYDNPIGQHSSDTNPANIIVGQKLPLTNAGRLDIMNGPSAGIDGFLNFFSLNVYQSDNAARDLLRGRIIEDRIRELGRSRLGWS